MKHSSDGMKADELYTFGWDDPRDDTFRPWNARMKADKRYDFGWNDPRDG